MPDSPASPESDTSSNLYASNDNENEQLQSTSSVPEPEQVAMDLSSDDSDDSASLEHNTLNDGNDSPSAQRKEPILAYHSYTPNGHNLKSPPLMSPTGFGEIHGLDTAQRKRKFSNEIGEARPNPRPGSAGRQARPLDGELIIQGQSSGGATSDSSHHKRAKLGHGSNLLPRNSVASVPWDRSLLPGEIWQRIFTFVPPAYLGRLLRVNSVFKTLLTPVEGEVFQDKEPHGSLKFDAPNSVWAASRRLYCPGMPRPLSSFSEHWMWKLLRNPNCQFCGKAGSVSAALPTSPWESGPGHHDVRIVWSFGIRCCGNCLMERTEKDMDLMFSSSMPFMLLPALPFSFITQSLNVISSITLRNSTPQPPGIQLVKYFFKPHIEEMKQKLEEVKSMGSATAEEWVKGLDATGKEKIQDAARWEQWEANGGLRALNSRHSAKPRDYDNHPSSQTVAHPVLKPFGQFAPVRESGSGNSTPNTNVKSANDSSNASPAHLHFPQGNGLPPRPSSPPARTAFPFPFLNHQPQPRVERSMKDVNEAKASRRAEIERRCSELDPPLPAAVLTHMESFLAAMQIPKVLTEADWEVLKPRLLAQREIAERRENERLMQNQLLQVKAEERRQQEAQLKEAKETLDREWEDVQKPIRDRLGSYADEIIAGDKWAGGEAVTKDKCAKFAAEVLLHVRRRFYDDVEAEDRLAIAAGNSIAQDSPNAPPKRKIILENMKWVFDTKVKPLTEQYQKDFFLCNGCENNNKYYGFEGVVQHYAAKHTNVLSMGSVVVHWRAEWPDTPPFNPDPSAGKYSYYGAPTPGMTVVPTASGIPMSQAGTYMPGTDYTPSMYSQPSPGPYGRPAYQAQYPSYGSEPYKPASPDLYSGPYPPPQQPYQAPHQNTYGYAQGTNYGITHVPYGNFPGPYQHPQPHIYGSPYPGQVYPAPISMSEAMPTPTFAATQYVPQPQPPYQPVPPQPQPIPVTNAPLSVPLVGFHQIQLDELAKNAREIWDGTSGIKDLPGSVRTFVIIQHVVLRFKDRYTNEPNLGLFTDGLNNHVGMRPLRTINGLTCKACATGLGEPSAFHPQPPHSEKKTYTLHGLLSHFQVVHIERAKPAVVPQDGIETPRLDWKSDMIELPESDLMRDLIHSPGMDDSKLQLIAQAVKGVFPSPLPKVVPAFYPGPVPVVKDDVHTTPSKIPAGLSSLPPRPVSPYSEDSRPASQPHRRSPSPKRGLEVAVDGFGRFVDSPMYEPALPEPPGDDEYDPHNPAPVPPVAETYGRPDHRKLHQKRSPLTSEFSDKPFDGAPPRSREYESRPASGLPDSDFHRYRQGPSELLRTYGASEPQRLNSPARIVSRDVSDFEYDPHRPIHSRQEFSTRTRPVDDYSKPAPVIGSEDGEVTASIKREDDDRIPKDSTNEMTDAERFLNNFVPGSEVEDVKTKQADYSNPFVHREDNARINWTEAAVQERRIYTPVDVRESHARKIDTNMSATAENSAHGTARGTPTKISASNGWSAHQKSPITTTEHSYEYRPEHPSDGLRPAAAERAIAQSPEYNPRLLRSSVPYHEPPRNSVDHHARRPNSRFDRYEAQRQPSYRPRSKSPQFREAVPVEATYHYRERSPQPRQPRQVYHASSPDALRDPQPIEESITYARIPSQGYQYVEEQRYVNVPYERRAPVQYIQVREPQSYYIERPLQREYVRYEGEYSEPPPQYYRVAAPRSSEIPERQDSLPRQYRYPPR